MANDKRKLDPVALSSLPAINDPKGFWIFVSKEKSDGTMDSGKYLFNDMQEQIQRLQLERRLSITMATEDFEMFIGEEMTIYKIESRNVATLKVNGVNVVPDLAVSVNIPAKSIVTFKVTRTLTDPIAYLFIYAKAKVI